MRTEQAIIPNPQMTSVIAEMHEQDEPILLTHNGSPAAYLIPVDLFSAMQEKIMLLSGLARGEKAISEGQTLTHVEVEKRPFYPMETPYGMEKAAVQLQEFLNGLDE